MSFDYSVLSNTEDGVTNTWREIYAEDLPLPVNLLLILQQAVFLPHDFYDIITAYFLLPSALCNVVPYLFFHGQSGSGKSALSKIAKYLHGVEFNSSSDTFAGIRNDLDQRKAAWVEATALNGDGEPYSYRKKVEKNTAMVWDDLDADIFTRSPDLYRLLKFGYDRTTDKITLSSKEVGENLTFRCFCPKIFSSITPLHLDDRFKELKRRLIVIPCCRVEELSKERLAEQNITVDDWQSKLLKIDAYDWTGFSTLFQGYWDLDMARLFFETRQKLVQSGTGLNSQQLAISTDLLATGIASGIWESQEYAVSRMKTYWQWFKGETEGGTSLGQLLKGFLAAEAKNARASGRPPEVYSQAVYSQVKAWVDMNWLLEPPKNKEVANLMYDQGWRFKEGRWSKG
jgi:hypothetical protein